MKNLKIFIYVFFSILFCIEKSYALLNFETFKSALAQPDYNVSLIDYENPLNFTDEPTNIALRWQIIGVSGTVFSKLDGGQNFTGFSKEAFEDAEYKFSGNIEFSNFARVFKYTTIHAVFERGKFVFSSNSQGSGTGSVFSIKNSTILEFLNSEAGFVNNRGTIVGYDIETGGGAINSLDNSAINIENSSIVFTNNAVTGSGIRYGGAVYAQNKANINFKNSNSKWMSNWLSQGYGAALYANESKVNFEGGSVEYSNNYVQILAQESQTFYATKSFVTFKNISARFLQNKTGSAIGAANSTVAFLNARTEFIGNLSPIAIEASSLSFIGAKAVFDKNKAALNIQDSNVLFANIAIDFTNSSGAFYAESSTMFFRNATAKFSNNNLQILSQEGAGAIYVDKTLLILLGGSASFTNNLGISENVLSQIAGAVYAGGASSVNFISIAANFANNNAENPVALTPDADLAGGLFINEGSTINFIGGSANFANNKNKALFIADKSLAQFINNVSVFSANEGAISIMDADALFLKSRASFIDNSGALQISLGAHFNVSNSTLIFRNNSGGAINLNNAVFNLAASSLSFIGNRTSQKGGAIAALNSTISFINANSPQAQIIFHANTAQNKPNDIYLENSAMFLSGNISMSGGIEALRSSMAYSGSLLFLGGRNEFRRMIKLEFLQGSRIKVQDAVFIYENNDVLALTAMSLSFINSNVRFNTNTGGGFYAQNSTVSFINGNVFFGSNTGPDIKAEFSEINIGADMEFSANTNAHIEIKDSKLNFAPQTGKSIRLKAKIETFGGNNIIRKTDYGSIVFDKSAPLILEHIYFIIEQGYAGFEIARSTFNEMVVSTNGLLGISVDFAAIQNGFAISSFYLDKMSVWDGGALSVTPINGHAAIIGTSAPFIYANSYEGTFENERIFGGRYIYSFHWQPNENGGAAGWLRFDKYIPPPIDVSNASFYADLRTVGSKAEFASQIRKGGGAKSGGGVFSIGNIGAHEAWSSLNFKGLNYRGDRSDGNFSSSIVDFKVGADIIQDGGVFAAYKNIKAARGGYKAAGAVFEFGIYKFLNTAPVDIGAALSFDIENFKVQDGSKVNSKSIKVSAEGDFKKLKFSYPKGEMSETEESKGGFSLSDIVFMPFAGLRGAYSMSGKIENSNDWIMPASRFIVLDILGGLKTSYEMEKLSFSAKVYLGFPIINKPEFELTSRDGTIDVESSKDGKLFAGLNIGGEYQIDPSLSAFTALSFERSSEGFGYVLNLGARYKF